MHRLYDLDAVRRLRAECPAYRHLAGPLLICFVACLGWGTDAWLGYRDDWTQGLLSVLYPASFLAPASYGGKTLLFLVYLLALVGAARMQLHDHATGAAQSTDMDAPAAKTAAQTFSHRFWLQSFSWFVHVGVLSQLALLPLLLGSAWGTALGGLALGEIFVLMAVPAILALQACDTMDAVVLVHKRILWPQICMQAQLWGVTCVAAALWLCFVFGFVKVCLSERACALYQARTLTIAAQMAVVALMPAHALASVRFVQAKMQGVHARQPNADVSMSHEASA